MPTQRPGGHRATKLGNEHAPGEGPKQDAGIRAKVARAERHTLAGHETALTDPARAAAEYDDAAPLDDVPQWGTDGTSDDGLVDDPDERGGDSDPMPHYGRWSRVSIWPVGDSFDYAVSLPRATDWSTTLSLAHLQRRWEELAEVLIGYHAAALRAETLPAAYLAMPNTTMKMLERSPGQGSRDNPVVIEILAGAVPFWFFAAAPKDPTLPASLVALARHAEGAGCGGLSAGVITSLLGMPHSAADGIRRRHGGALLAVRNQPAVLRRHRLRWPYTTVDELYDDLELTKESRSTPVAVLALTGAIFTGQPTSTGPVTKE